MEINPTTIHSTISAPEENVFGIPPHCLINSKDLPKKFLPIYCREIVITHDSRIIANNVFVPDVITAKSLLCGRLFARQIGPVELKTTVGKDLLPVKEESWMRTTQAEAQMEAERVANSPAGPFEHRLAFMAIDGIQRRRAGNAAAETGGTPSGD